jgi:hypothetical protein
MMQEAKKLPQNGAPKRAENCDGPRPKDGDSGTGKVRLVSLGDLDKRTGCYREIAALIDAIENELGGRDRLSSARRQVIEAGALATAMRRDLGVRWLNGEAVDPAAYATLCNCERRQYEAAQAYAFVPRDVGPSLMDILREDQEVQRARAREARQREEVSL